MLLSLYKLHEIIKLSLSAIFYVADSLTLNLGVSKSWVDEIFDMSLVTRESLFMKLSAIESEYKQLQRTLQSEWTT